MLIPAKEDIQHGNLAEWMKLHKPSVCHLTPAMGRKIDLLGFYYADPRSGQILLGGAVGEVPSLQNAVGKTPISRGFTIGLKYNSVLCWRYLDEA